MTGQGAEPETIEDARGGVYAEMKHDAVCERRAGDPDWVTEEQCTCLLPSLLDEYEAAVRRDERERTDHPMADWVSEVEYERTMFEDRLAQVQILLASRTAVVETVDREARASATRAEKAEEALRDIRDYARSQMGNGLHSGEIQLRAERALASAAPAEEAAE